MIFAYIGTEVVHALQEHNEFFDHINAMPQEERAAAIEARKKALDDARAERERKEMIEALKPHNLWSFLGLGKK